MTVKSKVLEVFENKRGQVISGTDLAQELEVSRNAVWKAVKSLQNEGYLISANTNKGYCLLEDNDILSEAGVLKYMDGHKEKVRIEVFQNVESTNTLMKTYALEGEKEGKVILAREQTKGRGRLGRNFYSPADTGIYMSILLRPIMTPEDSLFLTIAAAVSTVRAIETVSGQEAKIKWVNDIFCNEKKVCGILTEASLNVEMGKLEYAVVGIGLNVKLPLSGFPKDLLDIAGAVYETEPGVDIRCKLVGNILENFFGLYEDLSNKELIEEYRNKSMVIGRRIHYFVNGNEMAGVAKGIDDQARLIVETEEGIEVKLSSGEISIRVN